MHTCRTGRQNFVDGWEHEGAALAVYHRGRLVVDVWGGYADEASMRQWQRDTLTTVFSSTKVRRR
jgi:CubicO group peptidase (beta-lactamase class C family)